MTRSSSVGAWLVGCGLLMLAGCDSVDVNPAAAARKAAADAEKREALLIIYAGGLAEETVEPTNFNFRGLPRILKTPPPTVADVASAIGPADAVHDGDCLYSGNWMCLEWFVIAPGEELILTSADKPETYSVLPKGQRMVPLTFDDGRLLGLKGFRRVLLMAFSKEGTLEHLETSAKGGATESIGLTSRQWRLSRPY